MTADTATFTVPGRPEPRREPLHGPRGPYPHPANAAYYDVIRWAWRAAGGVRFGDAPIELSLTAIFTRPKSHWRRDGTLTRVGLESPWPTGRPDLSNVLKAIEDALNGLAFADDAQVIRYGHLAKVWARRPDDPPRTEVVIGGLTVVDRTTGVSVPVDGESLQGIGEAA